MAKGKYKNFQHINNPIGNKIVCIVGTHPTSRGDVPWDDKTRDVWIFNNQLLQGWVKRADVCFDIHPTLDIQRRGEEHPQFGQWLKTEKNMRFMTPALVPDCPNNELYPLDDIVNKLLPNFKRGEEINKYFTSGPAYAIALAIYKGYQQIEMYGIEMESDSEYIYQRDGVALWLGIALGRGIRVQLSTKSTMFYAPLYGFDDNPFVMDREAFVVRASELEQAMLKTQEILNVTKGQLDMLSQQINAMKVNGASEEELIKIAPQYEQATHAYEQAIANHAFVNGQYIDCKKWQAKIDKAMEYSDKSGEVLALRNEKWHRFSDRAELTGGFSHEGDGVGEKL